MLKRPTWSDRGCADRRFAKKVDSLALGILFGPLVGAFFAFLIALMPDAEDQPLLLADRCREASWIIVGYATQRYGVRTQARA